MLRALLLVLLFLWPIAASANCVDIVVTAWTSEQRHVLRHALPLAIAEPATAEWLVAEETVHICAPTLDVSGLTSATLQGHAQTVVDTRRTEELARDTEVAAIVTELDTSQFCRTATFAQIASRVAAQKAAVQTDIDAMTNIATAKTAMTTLNNRVWAAFEVLARCAIGEQRLRR